MFRKMMKVADIKVGDDRRPVHFETVKGIAESFKAVGQINPIVVDEDDNLIAGLHRVEAAKLCEWSSIEAGVMEAGDEAELVEIDENLQRHNYDALQFSKAVARRKRLWESVNGRIQRGRKPKPCPNSDTVSELPTVAKFNAETAQIVGKSERTVERAAAIGEKLSDKAAAVVQDTPIANSPTKLKAIADKPKAQQVAAAKQAVAEISKPKPNGKPATWHGDKTLESHYGKLVRALDEKQSAQGKSKYHKLCLDCLSQFLVHWNEWKASA